MDGEKRATQDISLDQSSPKSNKRALTSKFGEFLTKESYCSFSQGRMLIRTTNFQKSDAKFQKLKYEAISHQAWSKLHRTYFEN